ncbi:MAG: GNAT family N-acetyltransferase [Eubacteriales bacterium]|nr:GNAT family N-acetyltransferase [Eubacteriales bacterium]
MPDMLVNLLKLPKDDGTEASLAQEGIIIRRALAPDKFRIVPRVQELSSLSAAGECDVCFSHSPISTFIATKGATIIGYACYNATAKDFFGPTAVDPAYRGKGIGKVLLIRALQALRHDGFAYAIIGGVGPVPFYEKTVGATVIPDSDPGVYEDFLGRISKLENQ